MTYDQFVKLGEAMRIQQKAFFKGDPNSSERRQAFHESRRLEKQFDEAIENYKKEDSQLKLIE